MKELDDRIDELLRKPSSPETLNALGDLHLRKGNRVRAVLYYYQCVDMLHSGQKDKRIALYKKILKVSSAEEKAYEGLISLFAKMGLHAEEKRYLLRLIQLYQTKGEYDRVNSIFRRIQEIDPTDHLASTYFQQGKLAPLQPATPFIDDDARPDATAGLDGITDIEGEEPAREGSGSSEAEKAAETAAAGVRGDFPDEADTSAQLRPSMPVVTRSRLVLLAGVACVVLVIAVIAFLPAGKHRVPEQQPDASQSPAIISENTVEGYRVAISEYAQPRTQLGAVAEADFVLNRFFQVSVVMPSGCLPDAFVASPLENIAWMNDQGSEVPVQPVAGLEKMTRVIRKTNACDRESAPVFASFAVPLRKNMAVRSMQVKGLSQNGPLLIQWEAR